MEVGGVTPFIGLIICAIVFAVLAYISHDGLLFVVANMYVIASYFI